MNPVETIATTAVPESFYQIAVEAVSGPAAATVVMAMILYLAITKGFPLVERILTGHRSALDTIMTEHKEDRKAYQESMSALTLEIKGLSSNTQAINKKLEKLDERMEDVERKLR